jgi:hypothetical protein
MTATAYKVHAVSGRTRLKIPSRRGEAAYFAQVAERLTECPGVVQVRVNSRTASVLISHQAPFDNIAAFAAEEALFALAGESLHQFLSRYTSENLQWLDELLGLASNGSLDLRSMLIISLVGLSLLQIARGQILLPATSLLWYAGHLLDLKVSPSDDRNQENR